MMMMMMPMLALIPKRLVGVGGNLVTEQRIMSYQGIRSARCYVLWPIDTDSKPIRKESSSRRPRRFYNQDDEEYKHTGSTPGGTPKVHREYEQYSQRVSDPTSKTRTARRPIGTYRTDY